MNDEEAARGATTTTCRRKESLAAKTGEIRGAVERGVALTRSCGGQQNFDVMSVPTRVTVHTAGQGANQVLSFFAQILVRAFVERRTELKQLKLKPVSH